MYMFVKKIYISKWVKWARIQIFLFPFKIIYIVNLVWKEEGLSVRHYIDSL